MSSNPVANATESPASAPQPQSIHSAVEHAKRAFALKQYEQAADFYATALELAVPELGDTHLQVADLYLLYGKALLENAILQTSVLGKEKTAGEDETDDNKASTSNGGPILSFSGDAEEEDSAVDLFSSAQEAEPEQDDADDEDEDAEPEDDFNAAWEVLDLARAIYEKHRESESDEDGKHSLSMKVADTYITLGDVSLETEKFDQAITDYEQGLALKSQIFPFTSRQIAEAHYKLSIVLDLTSGRLSDAIYHAEKALESVESRIREMHQYLLDEPNRNSPQPDVKGKGKATVTFEPKDDSVKSMSRSQIDNEIKELMELKEDLALKVEELKTTPNSATKMSAPALAEKALDEELEVPGQSAKSDQPVNDLTSMVKKKKVPEGNATNSKRKADGETPTGSTTKRAKSDISDS